MDRGAETDSCEERRDQLGAGVREANAEIQSRSYCVRFECPDDIDRLVLHRGVDFFKVRLSRHLASSCNHFLTPALGDYVPLKRLFTEGRVAHGRRSITGLKSVHGFAFQTRRIVTGRVRHDTADAHRP
jgi:hypothetical protein